MSNETKKERRSVALPVIPKRLYTIEEAAIYLGRTVWSVRELIWSGTLTSVRVGRRVHLDFQDLNTFIDRHKVRETVL